MRPDKKTEKSKGFAVGVVFYTMRARNKVLQSTEIPTQNIMKTIINHLAVTFFAVAVIAPSAFAGMGVPRSDNWGYDTQPKAPKTEACKDSSCCSTKATPNNPLGRSGDASTIRVRTCNHGCKVSANNQKDSCNKGSRS